MHSRPPDVECDDARHVSSLRALYGSHNRFTVDKKFFTACLKVYNEAGSAVECLKVISLNFARI